MRLNIWDGLALLLMIVGSINWGFVGLFSVNPVEMIFGFSPYFARIIYILVGLCGLYGFFILKKCKKS